MSEAHVDTATTAAPDERRAPLSVRVVDRLGRALGGPGLSRRRFLARSAVVGAALAVDPVRYVLRPGSAYAQVCGDGASCGSGWTAFCCTVNDGANTCPEGSYVAGWWRIDDSPFCLGAARYVIDCNRSPGSSCSCRCADGACDQRRVCCNNFRYGQCNTQVAGVTEVVCRVVTCTTPWEWDPACSRTVRVDNRTRSHNSTCLPGRDATRIDIRYQDLGLAGSVLGRPRQAERAVDGGRLRRYATGTIYLRSSTGALAVHGGLDAAYRRAGGTSGPLGWPTGEPRATGVGRGQRVTTERGAVYQRDTATPAVGLSGRLHRAYRERGGPGGELGYPTDVEDRGDGATRVVFERGELVRTAGGSVVTVTRAFVAAADRRDLGWPVAAQRSLAGGPVQRFERGLVVTTTRDVAAGLPEALADAYRGAAAAEGRPLRRVQSVGGAQVLELADAWYVALAGGAVHRVAEPVLGAWLAEGGPTGRLGLPTGPSTTETAGRHRGPFVGGTVVVAAGGGHEVVRRRTASRASDVADTPRDSRRAPRRPEDVAP